MKTTIYQSAYLIPQRAQTPSQRINRALWRRSLRLPHISLRTGIGLSSWLAILLTVTCILNRQNLGTMRTVESLPPTHAVVNASVASVSILGPGPVGGTLPPGTLMTSGSFSNTYTRGQCTWYVASRRHVPSNWGDARNWYSRAANSGWSVGSSPAIGAIAWTSAGYYGHVAVVEAINSDHVQIAEMNYNGPYQIDRRWTTASQWRYIY